MRKTLFSARRAPLFTLFLFAAVPYFFSASDGTAESGFSFSGMAAGGVYTRTTPRALVIFEDGSLVIEESDNASRPTVRTEWKDGEEYASTTWEYSGEGMYPCARVTTSAGGTRRAFFDADGLETERAFFSADGAPLSRVRMEYAPATGERSGHDLISLTEEAFSPNGELLSSEKSVYSYNDDGSVRTLEVYKDGVIAKLIQYGEENYRRETVFLEGKEAFSAEYRDGTRVRADRRAAEAE